MPEIRDRQIMVSIEPTFYEAMQDLIRKDNITASGYVRTLIIRDLLSKGIITKNTLAMVMVGIESEENSSG